MTSASIEITVNGRQREVPAGSSLPDLLRSLEVDRRLVAVAHNGDVIPRDRHDQVVLAPGDTVEVVRMVGGG